MHDTIKIMSPAEYDVERAKLAPTKAEAGERWEQGLASLFARSGWTQQALAERENMSRQHVRRLLLLGQFLGCAPVGASAEKGAQDITEGRFRTYWGQTDPSGNHRQRFEQVRWMIENKIKPPEPRRPDISQRDFLDRFGDGKWHSYAAMAEAFDTEPDHIEDYLKRLTKASYERRKFGKSFEAQIFPHANSVSAVEIRTKLQPIIKRLKAEGRKKSPAVIVYGLCLELAAELQGLLDAWTKATEAGSASSDGVQSNDSDHDSDHE